ncbi:MAG: hypothetical protein AB7O62_04920 [Pirellulales bacterium]
MPDDAAQQIDDFREQQVAFVLFLGGLFDDFIYKRGGQGVLECTSHHDRHGTVLNELFKDIV